MRGAVVMISVRLAQARLNTSFIVIAMLRSVALYQDFLRVAFHLRCGTDGTIEN